MVKLTTRHRRISLRAQSRPAFFFLLLAALSGCGGDASPAGAAHRVSLTARGDRGALGTLHWVAFADGDGPFQVASPISPGRYDFDPKSDRYRLAFVCADTLQPLGEVIAATVAELSTIAIPCGPSASRPSFPWSGNVTGAPAGAKIEMAISAADDPLVPINLARGRYQAQLHEGTYDLVAVASSNNDAQFGLVIKRDLKVSGPGTFDIDFSSAIAPKVAPAPTVTNLFSGEQASAVVFGTTRNGAPLPLRAPAGQVGFLDGNLRDPGDELVLMVNSATRAGDLRGSTVTLGPALPATLELPAPLAEVSVSAASKTPITRPQVMFAPDPKAVFYQLSIASLGPSDMPWLMNVGAGWLGTGNQIELPDLSTLPGFKPAWGPPAQSMLLLQTTVVTSNRAFGLVLHGERAGVGAITGYAKKVASLAP